MALTAAEQAELDRLKARQARAQSYNPTEGMSALDKGLAGMGKAFVDTGRGIGQLAGIVSDEQIAESRRLDEPLMNTTPGMVGNIAGHMAQLPAGGSTLKGALGLGAGYSALQPGSMEERAINAGLGGAAGGLGQIAGQGISHILKPGRKTLPQAQTLMGADIPLSPADQTGSRVLHFAKRNYNTMGDELVCTDPMTGAKLWSTKLKGKLSCKQV